jgi:glucose uptake protein GlcU
MAYIVASILASTSILVLFRWMQHSAAVTRHAIVVSYLTSAAAGALVFTVDWGFIYEHWFWYAALEGTAFYLVFRMMAFTTEQAGITVASIATKMSVVIPTFIGIAALGESIRSYKIAGLLFGLVSVILAAGSSVTVKRWILPLMVFACTGLIDASFKLFQVWGLDDAQFPGFVITVFGFAFIAAALHHLLLPNRIINPVSAGAGVALGLANLGTVYFILMALAQPDWESSVVFPLNNFGIVLVSTLTAIFVFGEKTNVATRLSLTTAFVSIALLYAAT